MHHGHLLHISAVTLVGWDNPEYDSPEMQVPRHSMRIHDVRFPISPCSSCDDCPRPAYVVGEAACLPGSGSTTGFCATRPCSLCDKVFLHSLKCGPAARTGIAGRSLVTRGARTSLFQLNCTSPPIMDPHRHLPARQSGDIVRRKANPHLGSLVSRSRAPSICLEA